MSNLQDPMAVDPPSVPSQPLQASQNEVKPPVAGSSSTSSSSAVPARAPPTPAPAVKPVSSVPLPPGYRVPTADERAHGPALVGAHVCIYWDGEGEYYKATVTEHDAATGLFTAVYEVRALAFT